jgi:signal transduction histidine kinase
MLRTLNFRTKLLCILAVPVVALVATAAFAGTDRLHQATDTAQLRHRIDVVAAGQALSTELQLEEGLSANLLGQGPGGADTLAQQRQATDRKVTAWHTAVQKASDAHSTTWDKDVARVERSLQGLPSVRQTVDGGTDLNSFVVSFQDIADGLRTLDSTVSEEANEAGLARNTAALAALSRQRDAVADQWAVLLVALSRGGFQEAQFTQFRDAVAEGDQWQGVFQATSSDKARADVQRLVVGEPVFDSDAIARSALATGTGKPLAGNPAAWTDAMTGRLHLMGEALGIEVADVSAAAAHIQSDAEGALRGYALLVLAAVLVSILLALVLARRVTRPLRRLTEAAEQLAGEQLPALVSGLKSPSEDDQRYLAATMRPIDISSRDEIGQLARAFNAVQAVAVDVAAEQSDLLRKGIGEIFVNLARRNQVLIDRQIEFLDELEATEDDPDQLAQLYRLDHLATRMRRNAESLLVLAGVEPNRKRTKPVPLVDVVRAAMGEVEDFARVDLAAFDDVRIAGNAAVDLAHLLAELLENATHFSSPDTRVEVEGRRSGGGYVMSVTDQGIGMATDQVDEANALLAAPPPVGLALGRSLGFTVVARLAARYSVTVRLMGAPSGGVAAVIHLPGSLVLVDADEASAAATNDQVATPAEPKLPEPPAAPAPGAGREPAHAHLAADIADHTADVEDGDLDAVIARAWDDDLAALGLGRAVQNHPASGNQTSKRRRANGGSAGKQARPPATLRDAVPEGMSFEEGLAELLDDVPVLPIDSMVSTSPEGPRSADPPGEGGPPDPRRPAAPPEPVDDAPAPAAGAPAPAGRAGPAMTAAGLVRRVPKAASASGPNGPGGGSGDGDARPNIAATRRSPDDVRALLARYRSGLQRGRVGEVPTTDPEERS